MLHKNVWRMKRGNGQLESRARNGRGCEKLKGECPSKRHPYVLAPVDQCPWHSFFDENKRLPGSSYVVCTVYS